MSFQIGKLLKQKDRAVKAVRSSAVHLDEDKVSIARMSTVAE